MSGAGKEGYVTLASLSGIHSVLLGFLDFHVVDTVLGVKEVVSFSALRSGDAINRSAVKENLVLLCI